MPGRFPPRLKLQRPGPKPNPRMDAELVQSYDTSTAEELEITQRFEKRLAEYNASGSVLKRWYFETLAWLVSALCLCAIITIYAIIKDQPMANLGNLLTFTNIIGKVATAALIVPTTEALGQLKWNWFSTSNAIWDFEIFDKATRGPWGAAMLLYCTKGRSLASLGAVLILLLLALDSFLQKMVELPERWALHGEPGTVRRVVRYEADLGEDFTEGMQLGVPDKDIQLVASKFFYGNGTQPIAAGNRTRPDVPVSCPTSSYVWPIYDTLGVCTQCTDTSSYLDFACIDGKVDWTMDLPGGCHPEDTYPNATMCGYFLNTTNNPQTLMMSEYLVDPVNSTKGEAPLVRTLPMVSVFDKIPVYANGSLRLPRHRNPFADVLIVSAANGVKSVYQHEVPMAQECVLSWCVKTIKSSYDSGTLNEEVIATLVNTTAGEFPWLTVPGKTDADEGASITYQDNITIQGTGIDWATVPSGVTSKVPMELFDDTNFGLSNDTAYTIMSIFDDAFPSFYTAKNESTEPVLRFQTYLSGPAYTRKPKFNPWSAPNDVTIHMARLATAMTNQMRTFGTEQGGREIPGAAYRREVYVRVQWGWLAFPLALLVLSLIFLVATILKTSANTTTGVWKTSAMPTLIYGLPKETQGQFNPSSTWSSTQKQGRKVRVKLSPKTGWRVSGESSLKKSPVLPLRKSPPPLGWI